MVVMTVPLAVQRQKLYDRARANPVILEFLLRSIQRRIADNGEYSRMTEFDYLSQFASTEVRVQLNLDNLQRSL